MKEKEKIYGLLGLARRAGKISFGTQSVQESIEKRKAKLVIVAEDASQRTKHNFIWLCERAKIPIRIWGKIENLSESIGQANKAVIAIQEENLVKELSKRIDGGEIIG